ncbi:hypothetical protein L1887_38351 [Cichorium endivia]|nr:hypothetical protein L1887_38351 [Cichorium endivia]
MDWYSWLSKTNLDPYLVYEYGRTFTHNELQRGDTTYFNHEFLQSMGVSVAKHRLEILNLARNNVGGCPKNGFSKIAAAIVKTRLLLSKKLGRFVSKKRSVDVHANPFRPQWPSSNLRKNMGFGDNKDEKVKTRMKSGPLDGRVEENYMSPKRVFSVSGPIDVGNSPRIGIPYSTVMNTASDDDGMSSIWSMMFQDMKPT